MCEVLFKKSIWDISKFFIFILRLKVVFFICVWCIILYDYRN